MNKKRFGQFYTTRAEYIVGNLLHFFDKKENVVLDPFAGEWDLLNLLKNTTEKEAYDIDPKNDKTIKVDSFVDKIDFCGKRIFTNPPYLARNKAKEKKIYDSYKTDDLYKASIKLIIGYDAKKDIINEEKSCEDGILIIPLNFFCDEDNGLRKMFLSRYEIKKLNIFEEQVFEDTSYTVCSFYFRKRKNEKQVIETIFMPSGEMKDIVIEERYGYKIGGSFLQRVLSNKDIKVERLTVKNKDNRKIFRTNLFLRAIDTGGKNGRIALSFNNEKLIGKETDRSFATILIGVRLDKKQQEIVINKFNKIIEKMRYRHNSLFLTNFRNSTENYARKRISFELAFRLISYIVSKYILKQSKSKAEGWVFRTAKLNHFRDRKCFYNSLIIPE